MQGKPTAEQMALPASAQSLYSFRVKLLKGQPCQLQSHFLIHARNRPIYATSSVKLPTMAQFHDPLKVKLHMHYVKEKLWDVIPETVKEFPWKKAQAIALRQLLVGGQEALKWFLIALFALSSFSDILYSISINKELLIPFGLFVGFLIYHLLREMFRELFPNSEERGLSWHLFIIGCFFVLVKILSAYIMVGRGFLLHAANGGLMQILFDWRSLLKEQGDNSFLEDAFTAKNAED